MSTITPKLAAPVTRSDEMSSLRRSSALRPNRSTMLAGTPSRS
ncbi:MAG TPA: hypothetical protein VK307_01370 [Thermoleophilaceae bacterium]|nr:hypothetical protein [Thermoleophilaceae bacterium]